MNANLYDLQHFSVICELGNLTRASERLGLSQPALSQSLKRLESVFETQLLFRDKSGVRPTKAGEALLRESRNLIGEWEALKRKVSSHQREVVGHITLGAHDAVAAYTYPHFLKSLIESYPDLHISFQSGLSREICEAVVSQTIDLALVINPFSHPDLILTPLLEDRVMLYTSSKKLPDDAPLLIHPGLMQTQALMKKITQKIGPRRILNFTSLENIARLTESGLGIGLIPSQVVKGLTPTVKLTPLHPEIHYRDQLYLVTHVNSRSTMSIQTASKFIQKKIKALQ